MPALPDVAFSVNVFAPAMVYRAGLSKLIVPTVAAALTVTVRSVVMIRYPRWVAGVVQAED